MRDLLEEGVKGLDEQRARNPSFVYVAALREAIHRGFGLDRLHYSDVLVALRNLGFSLDAKTGLFDESVTSSALAKLPN